MAFVHCSRALRHVAARSPTFSLPFPLAVSGFALASSRHQSTDTTSDTHASSSLEPILDVQTYNDLSTLKLEQLLDQFEDAAESNDGWEVEWSNTVLSLKTQNGTYVLNKQTPNRQIWLSSPISGPKRYDWVPERKSWIYKRTDKELWSELKEELRIK